MKNILWQWIMALVTKLKPLTITIKHEKAKDTATQRSRIKQWWR